MTIVGAFEQLLSVFALAGIERQITGLIQRIQVAGLLVMPLPKRSGFGLTPQNLEHFGAAFEHFGGLRLVGKIRQGFVVATFVLPDIQQALAAPRVPRLGQACALQQVSGLQALGKDQPCLGIVLGLATV
ncbi:hypothetical protein D3C87_1261840 [compost metagenome]